MKQTLSFLLKPATTLSSMLGCSRSLILLAIVISTLSISLTYAAFSAMQANAEPLTSIHDLIVFSSLATFLSLYFLLGFLFYIKGRVQTFNASANDIVSGNFSTSPFSTESDEMACIQNSMAHIAKQFDRLLNVYQSLPARFIVLQRPNPIYPTGRRITHHNRPMQYQAFQQQ